MARYTKGFVRSSLFYFFLAAGHSIWMGMVKIAETVKFACVHSNLPGFMAMTIYGGGYFILPRFNARSLK